MKIKKVFEAGRDVQIVGEYDVIVCGGGPAGIAAAVSSSRHGAKTALIEVGGCLGGIWTSGLMPWVIDGGNKSGLMSEIDSLLKVKELPISGTPPRSAYDVELTKYRLEQFCLGTGIKVRLHTRVSAAICENRNIKYVITESKSGREAWSARVFVDATGDGDLAALSGCSFDYGRPDFLGEAQPMSFVCMVTGIHLDEIMQFVNGADPSKDWAASKVALKNRLESEGVSPSYSCPTIFHVYDDLFIVMANHQYGVCSYNADDITRATIEGRDEVFRIISALRRSGEPWKNLKIVATSSHIGVREGRRIHGLYTLTKEDLERGAEFPDAVCRVTFCVDIHSTNSSRRKGLGNGGVKVKPYDIPLRSLVAKDVSNLMLAGRCISGDFFAHASYRVTGNAVPTGEAAGRTAALAAIRNVKPSELLEIH